ncbi:MAG: hypothetical protein P1U35_02870 [Cycloclasticus sp.]|nr:hypothetical protein [Cycloclasticus sp.]
MKDHRGLLPKGEKKALTKEEFEEWNSEYNQQQRLLDVLEGWSEHASSILIEYARTHEKENKILERIHTYSPTEYFPEQKGLKVCWYDFDMSDQDEARDASDVLKAIKEVWDATFQNDKNALANASIDLGFTLARAEVFKYEGTLAMGKSEGISREKTRLASKKHHAQLNENKKQERKAWVSHARETLVSTSGKAFKKSDVTRSVIRKFDIKLTERHVSDVLFETGKGKPIGLLRSY